MMQVSAHSYASAAEMLSAYADRRRRLMSAAPRREPILLPVRTDHIVVEDHPPAPRPLWKRGDVEFTAHIEDWHIFLREQTSAVRYIKRRAPELGFLYREIISSFRGHKVTAARMLLMWEVKHKFPQVSYPQLGRMFGGRDHTTAIHAVRKIEAQRGQS